MLSYHNYETLVKVSRVYCDKVYELALYILSSKRKSIYLPFQIAAPVSGSPLECLRCFVHTRSITTETIFNATAEYRLSKLFPVDTINDRVPEFFGRNRTCAPTVLSITP